MVVPPEPAMSLPDFLKKYQCNLYNHLRVVDALPDKEENRFVILEVDDQLRYDQAWLFEDHKTVYIEVSSLFYLHKKGEPREYWPRPVQVAIAKAGFNLQSGQDENYNYYLRQPDVRQLWDVAGLMLTVAYTAFDAEKKRPQIKTAQWDSHPLSPDESCAYPELCSSHTQLIVENPSKMA